jgi:hypothetical protein
MSGGLNVPNVNAVTVTANSSGFSIAGGSSASKTLTVSNSVTVSGNDGSTLNIGAGGTLQSGAFQVSSQGTTGAQGVQGTTGIQGSVGTQGTLGTQGSTGAQGTVGGAGIQGSTGSQGTGGAQGATGSQGAQGVQGTQGRTGAQGSTGTQGAVGSTGGTGATGSTGVQGTTGATGAQGTSGATILGSANTWTNTNSFSSLNITGDRPITFSTSNGSVSIKGNSGGWATGYYFIGSSGTDKGGFGALGGADALTNYWIGPAYNNYYAVITSDQLTHTSSVRSPIFYDSNDTGYYIDPNSTSNSALKVRGGAIFGPNTTWAASLYVGTNGNVSGTATMAVTNGNIHIDTAGSSYPLYLQYYCGGYTQAYGSMRSPIFYDLDNTGYYCDPASTSNINAITIAGQINQTGPGRTATVSTSNYDAKFGSSDLYFYLKSVDGGNGTCGAIQFMRVSDGLAAWPIVLNPTGANVTIGSYADYGYKLGVNGNIYSITNTYTATHGFAGKFIDNTNGAGNLVPFSFENGYPNHSYGMVARFRVNGSGDRPSIQFSSGASNTRWNVGYCFYDDNFRITQNLGTNNDGSDGGWGSERFRINTDGTVNVFVDMRAPIFYDSNNTGYYADFNSTGDSIRCAGNITAYYSDERLKTHLGKIENAIDKVKALEGFYYEANSVAQSLGYKVKREVGVGAQAVQKVLPEIVSEAPASAKYLTIDYSKLTPLLIEAVKEQQQQIENQQKQIEELKALINNK